jgi:hypothetical protein
MLLDRGRCKNAFCARHLSPIQLFGFAVNRDDGPTVQSLCTTFPISHQLFQNWPIAELVHSGMAEVMGGM